MAWIPNLEALRVALKEAREAKGLTQEEVGELAGMNKSVISRIEQGISKEPGFATIAKLAFAYQLSLEHLARTMNLPAFKEIRTDAGWAAVDSQLVSAIRMLFHVEDVGWKDALVENFYDTVLTKANDEAIIKDLRAELEVAKLGAQVPQRIKLEGAEEVVSVDDPTTWAAFQSIMRVDDLTERHKITSKVFLMSLAARDDLFGKGLDTEGNLVQMRPIQRSDFEGLEPAVDQEDADQQ